MNQLFLVILQKMISLLLKMKFKVAIWRKEYCTLHPVVYYLDDDDNLAHKSFCFLMIIIMTSAKFIYDLQIIWKSIILVFPCCFTFLMDVLGSVRIVKTSSTYTIILIILEWMQSGYFLQQATENHHVMVLVDLLSSMLPRGACSDHWTIEFWTMKQWLIYVRVWLNVSWFLIHNKVLNFHN